MVGRDVIYDITALQQDGLSVDRYFPEANDGETPSSANGFTDGVSAAQIQAGAILETLHSPNYVSGTAGWIIKNDGSVEFNSGDFRGNVTVNSIDIGGNDSSSAHIDTDGNFWTGANNSSYATAPARISKAGAAHFENVEVGGTTIQYVITNSGIFSFGDGSDSDVTISVDTTLSADKYYNNLTVNSGVTLNPGSYRIFVKNTLTVNGTIARNGNNGTSGGSQNGGGTGGTGGSALADGYLKGSLAGGNGGTGANGNGTAAVAGSAGASTSNSIGTANGSAGQAGGNQSGNGSGAAGAGGTTTQSNVKLIANWHLATLLDVSSTGSTVKFNNTAASGGGGGGSGSVGGINLGGGGGGGAGSNGGIVAIYARSIIIGASGSILANGGNGGNGGAATAGETPGGSGAFWIGNGGGGAGGNGGIIILCYNSLTNGGTIAANAGTGGSGGGSIDIRGGNSAIANTSANNGSAGVVYLFQLSL